MRTVWRLCWLTAVAVSLILATPSFAAPSFNCASATQPDEIVICGSAWLSDLDDVIATAYAWLKTLRGRPYADQTAIPHWRARQACQSDARCIEQREIEEIKAFQALGAPVCCRLRRPDSQPRPRVSIARRPSAPTRSPFAAIPASASSIG